MGFDTRTLALATTALALVSAAPAAAQTTTPTTGQQGASTEQQAAQEEVVVTGSRIRRAATDTPAPVSIIGRQQLDDRGYTSASEALNTVPAITPAIPQSTGNAATLNTQPGAGGSYPNLFNLGAGRTLTLLDGRRMVTTASGGDRVVDTNIFPIGLLDRIDVVEAGGAAVYGSDAIAGVVNYVLKKNYNGIEADAQYGISDRGDYPERSARLTAGHNFAGGRGNIAFDVEYSKTDPLLNSSRPDTSPYTITAPNPADTGPNDGISSVIRLPDARFAAFNRNGVIFTLPAPIPLAPCGNQICFLRSGGVPQQFAGDGQSIASYNPGTVYTTPYANGGQGESFGDLSSLYVGVQRVSANAMAHYDLTDKLTFSVSGLFADVKSYDPLGTGQAGVIKTVLSSPASGVGYLTFNKNNPFLTAADITALSAAAPSFAAGAPLFLSKSFTDLLTSNASTIETKTYRGLASLDGNFNAGSRRFDYSVSFSHGEVDGNTQQYGLYGAHFNNAYASTKNAAGQTVCAINATTVTDAGCYPINPFGDGNSFAASGNVAAARAYVSVPVGSAYHNKQDDLLATLAGDVFKLPAGGVKFSVGYEHRGEATQFYPAPALQQGLVVGSVAGPNTSASFHTDEFSGELLVPLVGGDFTLPLVQKLEVNGQYRRVDNSVAGNQDVWGVNGRWEVVSGLTLRASRSRNFRAPTLDQLFAPAVTNPGGILIDPCDTRFINAGPNPAVRRANCVALFNANPGYNGGKGLTGFTDANANVANAAVTTTGNTGLQNEVSDTVTFGAVLQPRFIRGLTITADRIQVNIGNGLITYQPYNFTQACFDATTQDPAFCNTFTRDANGNINTATVKTVNAALVRYRGETYKLDYDFGLSSVFGGADKGDLDLDLEVTRNEDLKTVAAGVSTEQAGTTTLPSYVMRLDARYHIGPLRLTYEGIYLPATKVNSYDTIENTPTPVIASNMRHSVSVLFDIKNYEFRFGVTNLTDKLPSYPTLNYGDILGRRYFAGARVRF